MDWVEVAAWWRKGKDLRRSDGREKQGEKRGEEHGVLVCAWRTGEQDVEQDDVDAAYRREPPAGKRRPVAGTKAAAESTHSRRRRAAAAIGEILRERVEGEEFRGRW